MIHNNIDHQIQDIRKINYNHCVLAEKGEKFIMIMAACRERLFIALLDALFDKGYEVSKLRKEAFISYFNYPETNDLTFLIEDDDTVAKVIAVLKCCL